MSKALYMRLKLMSMALKINFILFDTWNVLNTTHIQIDCYIVSIPTKNVIGICIVHWLSLYSHAI